MSWPGDPLGAPFGRQPPAIGRLAACAVLAFAALGMLALGIHASSDVPSDRPVPSRIEALPWPGR